MVSGRTGAIFSRCRAYRYRLWRAWGDADRRCVFVGLNPSTADDVNDDPTIRKCVGFAARWGFGAIDVVSLFGAISTKPAGLLKPSDPVGLENDAHLEAAVLGGERIVWDGGGARNPLRHCEIAEEAVVFAARPSREVEPGRQRSRVGGRRRVRAPGERPAAVGVLLGVATKTFVAVA